MNPLVLGLYRKQEAEAAKRALLIRMDIAARTGYLNPQIYSAYLSGATEGMPPIQDGPLQPPVNVAVPVMPATVPAGSGSLPDLPAQIAAGIVPLAYAQTTPEAIMQAEVIRAQILQQQQMQQNTMMQVAVMKAKAARENLEARIAMVKDYEKSQTNWLYETAED